MLKKLSRTLQLKKHLEREIPEYQVSLITDDSSLAEAQRLHANVYLERGFVQAHQLGRDGRIMLMHDPYRNHSQYFAVKKSLPGESGTGPIVATVRMIMGRPSSSHNSFPTLSKIKLYPNMLNQIKTSSHTEMVEISGLAKMRGHSPYVALLLYRAMWQHSVEKRHKLWLMACDSKVYSRLKLLFGDALVEIGDEVFYMGSTVTPAMLDVARSLDIAIKTSTSWNPATRQLKRLLVVFFLRGLPQKYLSAEQIDILEKNRLWQRPAVKDASS